VLVNTTMNEQRRQILQMLAEGKITADEAERLIDALEREQPDAKVQVFYE
jgi:polyhydroxyalkanoate synthesis regulator phasin